MRRRFGIVVLAIAAAWASSAAYETRVRILRVDPALSLVGFELAATMHTVHGESRALEGEVRATFDGDEVRFEGKVVLAASSLHTGNSRRDRKMHEESFAVERFPSIVFDPERLEAPLPVVEPPGISRRLLHGRLTIRDVTRPVTLEVRVDTADDRFKVTGEMTVALADYGIPDPSVLLLRVAKAANASFEIVFVPAPHS